MDNSKLIELAKEARKFAFPELSGFKVGAALLTKCGKVYKGCNVEDPSGIGVTNICAERCAIVKAVSEGYRDFTKIAVVGGMDELIFCLPCGACRQYINSFNAEMTIVSFSPKDNEIKEFKLSELLPYSFDEKF